MLGVVIVDPNSPDNFTSPSLSNRYVKLVPGVGEQIVSVAACRSLTLTRRCMPIVELMPKGTKTLPNGTAEAPLKFETAFDAVSTVMSPHKLRL
jgi:hypothetical protein